MLAVKMLNINHFRLSYFIICQET